MSTIRHMRITVEGKTYDVSAELLDEDSGYSHHHASGPYHAPAVAIPSTFHPAVAAAKTENGGTIFCPISGMIVSIHVQQGQQVKKGDTLITLEAMKMNTPVFAPQDGTVTSLRVQEGMPVEEGAVIAVLS